MGGSSWNDDYYRERSAERARTNVSAFAYHDAVKAKPIAEQKVHEKMDPKGVAFRESRDSIAHPESIPIGIVIDVTGSMSNTPRVFQQDLPKLNATIKKVGGVEHGQILFGAQGDATSDRGSSQIGQFESGIEMDDDLGRLWLEGGGGGSRQESYQNAIYFFARHTVSDHWEKRQKKGYLFLIGDEYAYPNVSKEEVQVLFGDSLQSSIPTQDIVKECQERYNVFFIIPQETSNGRNPDIQNHWRKLLGDDHVIILDHASDLCETVALAIGLTEQNGTAGKASDLVNPQVIYALRALAKSAGVQPSGKTIRL